jgi:hypothetical protein
MCTSDHITNEGTLSRSEISTNLQSRSELLSEISVTRVEVVSVTFCNLVAQKDVRVEVLVDGG